MTKSTLCLRMRFAAPWLLLAALAACGGGGSSSAPMTTYTVGGTVTGLAGSGLVLQNNGGSDLALSATGSFTFSAGLANGAAYSVTVMTQPSAPAQDCVVTNGSGTVGAANVTNVAVACSLLTTYTVGGTVTGLTGSGLELDYYDTVNPPVPLAVSAAGAFIFPVDATPGSTYQVAVGTQPSSPTQNCVVTNGTGVIATGNVTNVSVVCSDPGRFAFVANAGDDTISVYSIDSTTGALTGVGTVVTGAMPYAIAGSPDGQHVYVTNEVTNDISAYAVNTTSGALSPIAGSPFAAGTDPKALSFDRSGGHLYVANNGSNNLSAYAVNASSGALTPLPIATYATGTGPSAISVDDARGFVFVANHGGSNDISVFAITTGTGALTAVAGSPFAAGGNPHALAYAASEQALYSANSNGASSTISGFRVFPTGDLQALQKSPFTLAVDNYIATDRNGGCLYVTTGGGVVGYGIVDAGVLIPLSGFPVASGTNAYSVTVDPSNQFLYVGNDGAGNVSGYKRNGCGLTAIPGSPFAAGNNPDLIAIH